MTEKTFQEESLLTFTYLIMYTVHNTKFFFLLYKKSQDKPFDFSFIIIIWMGHQWLRSGGASTILFE